MKPPVKKQPVIVAILLVCTFFQAAQVFAQDKKEENGTIRIRIEKQKDGKTEVIEKIYESGEWPGSFPEAMFFNFSDSFSGFGDHLYHLNMLNLPEMPFHSDDNSFFFQEGMDSLLRKQHQMAFKFEHEFKPSFDSLMHKLTDNQDAFNFHFNSDFNIDSMLNLKLEGMKNFQFNWSGDSLDGKNFNLMLDKELYNVEETEDANGNKVIRITPKIDGKDGINGFSKNSKNYMQPSPSQLNLSYDQENGSLKIGIKLPNTGNTVLTITGPEGKEIYKETLKNFSGIYNKEINLKNEDKGIYQVQFTQNNTSVTKKLEIP